jgi:hypothetical protein
LAARIYSGDLDERVVRAVVGGRPLKGAGGDLTRFSPPEIPAAVSIFKTAYSRPDTGSRTAYALQSVMAGAPGLGGPAVPA